MCIILYSIYYECIHIRDLLYSILNIVDFYWKPHLPHKEGATLSRCRAPRLYRM